MKEALQKALEALEWAEALVNTSDRSCQTAAWSIEDALSAVRAALAKPDPTIKVNSAGTVAVAQGVFWLPIDKQAPLGVRLLLINRAAGRATDGQLGSHEKFFDHYQAFPQFRR